MPEWTSRLDALRMWGGGLAILLALPVAWIIAGIQAYLSMQEFSVDFYADFSEFDVEDPLRRNPPILPALVGGAVETFPLAIALLLALRLRARPTLAVTGAALAGVALYCLAAYLIYGLAPDWSELKYAGWITLFPSCDILFRRSGAARLGYLAGALFIWTMTCLTCIYSFTGWGWGFYVGTLMPWLKGLWPVVPFALAWMAVPRFKRPSELRAA